MNSKTLQINGVDPTLEWVEKEENCSSNVSEFPNSEPKNLVYLKTPDEKFHIVYGNLMEVQYLRIGKHTHIG